MCAVKRYTSASKSDEAGDAESSDILVWRYGNGRVWGCMGITVFAALGDFVRVVLQ